MHGMAFGQGPRQLDLGIEPPDLRPGRSTELAATHMDATGEGRVGAPRTVVFTGDGENEAGRILPRFVWKKMAEAMNVRVQGAVSPATDVLVASRTDTVKARGAVAHGIKVITYSEFLVLYHEFKVPRAARENTAALAEREKRVRRSLYETFSGVDKHGRPDPLSIPL